MTKVVPNVTFTSLDQLLKPENAAEFVRQISDYGKEQGKEGWLWDFGVLVDIRNLSAYRITSKEVGETVRDMHPDTSLFVPYHYFFTRFTQVFYAKLGLSGKPTP